MGKLVVDIVSWTIIAALIVLVVMNASNVAIVITSLGGFWGKETAMFTGAGYSKASGNQYNQK